MVAERSPFLLMSQGREEAETDYLARLREPARYCKFVGLKASLDPEAQMIRIQFIALSIKLKLLEALRTNDNLTLEELLQLIQYRTQAKRFTESSVHQSISSVVAYAENVASILKKIRVVVRNQSSVNVVNFHPLKAIRQEASRTERKTSKNQSISVPYL